MVEGLIKNGKVVRGYLGVMLYPGSSTPTIGSAGSTFPNNRGALIIDVQPGSPAEQAGLKPGDVIVKLADREVADARRSSGT